MKMEQTESSECSETSAYKLQTPGHYPKESIKHIEHGESLKSRILVFYYGWCDRGSTPHSLWVSSPSSALKFPSEDSLMDIRVHLKLEQGQNSRSLTPVTVLHLFLGLQI